MVKYFTQQTSLSDFKSTDITRINTLEEVYEELKNEKEICLDVETTGLDPLIHPIVMLQLGIANKAYVMDVRGVSLEPLRPLLENNKITFIGHNIKFDYNMLKGRDIILQNVYDTMVADRVINNGLYSPDYIKKHKRYSLAGVYKHYFNFTPNKTVRDEFVTWGGRPFTEDQVTYGALDVKYPLEIKKVQDIWITRYELEKTLSLEMKVLLAIGDTEYNGVYIDPEKWMSIYKTYVPRAKETALNLDKALIAEAPKYELKAFQQDLFGPTVIERLTGVKWTSDIQVRKILNGVFKIFPKDKHGKDSSGKAALNLMHSKHPFTDLLLKHREETKIIDSFGKKFLEKFVKSDKRLHSNFNQIVDTGRMSSRNPNMQQIPKGSTKAELNNNFRGAFTATNADYKIITADYSAQEQRVLGDAANDENFIEFFKVPGQDIHCFDMEQYKSLKLLGHPNFRVRREISSQPHI